MCSAGGFGYGLINTIHEPVAFSMSNPKHELLLISVGLAVLFMLLLCVRMILWAKKNKTGVFAQKTNTSESDTK